MSKHDDILDVAAAATDPATGDVICGVGWERSARGLFLHKFTDSGDKVEWLRESGAGDKRKDFFHQVQVNPSDPKHVVLRMHASVPASRSFQFSRDGGKTWNPPPRVTDGYIEGW